MDAEHSLQKWFEAAKKGATIKLNLDVLFACLRNDIKIETDSISNKNLVDTLPYILYLYMEQWPGWSTESDSTLNEDFGAFKEYLTSKLSYYISTLYDSARKEVIKENNGFAPYRMQIKCPPHLVNSLVFTKHGEHGIVLKQHLGRKWDMLSMTQLIHWPHVEVTFSSNQLSFTRTQAIEFIRCLNFPPVEQAIIANNLVENIELVDGLASDRKCFTYNFLNEYTKEYLETLKEKKELDLNKIEEIQTLLYHFLEDIKDINLLSTSIATNTKILMKYGANLSYIRNKKLLISSTNTEKVGFCEILVPKVEFILHYCHVEEDETGNDVGFKSNREIKTLSGEELKKIVPKIFYKCIYCNVQFSSITYSRNEIMIHLIKEHKMEHPVRCTNCKRQFEVTNLTTNRWRHLCLFSK